MNVNSGTQDKVWGTTKCIFMDHASETHYLEVKAGGYSSRHKHRKTNLFLLVSGILVVETFEEGTSGLIPLSVINLIEGIPATIPPGVIHRFNAVTDCKVIEIYWTEKIDPGDIVRFDVGGLNSPCLGLGNQPLER